MNCRDSSDELDAVWLLGGSAARLARWCGAVAVERRCGGSAERVAPGAGQQAAARQRGGGGGGGGASRLSPSPSGSGG